MNSATRSSTKRSRGSEGEADRRPDPGSCARRPRRNAAELLRGWDVGRVVINQSLWWNGTVSNGAVQAAIRDEPGLEETFPHAGQRFDWGGADGSSSIHRPMSSLRRRRVPPATRRSPTSCASTASARCSRATSRGASRSESRRILDPAVDEPVDIFLATHHGSKEGSVDELLEVIRPRWAVLSTGTNSHQHPSLEAIGRLEAAGASIWCTEPNGSVTARISARGTLTWRASIQVCPVVVGEVEEAEWRLRQPMNSSQRGCAHVARRGRLSNSAAASAGPDSHPHDVLRGTRPMTDQNAQKPPHY